MMDSLFNEAKSVNFLWRVVKGIGAQKIDDVEVSTERRESSICLLL
jgi:hypothetical protein